MIGGCGGETRGGSSPPFGTIAMDEEFRLGESARTANPVQTTRFLGVKKGEIGGEGCLWGIELPFSAGLILEENLARHNVPLIAFCDPIGILPLCIASS